MPWITGLEIVLPLDMVLTPGTVSRSCPRVRVLDFSSVLGSIFIVCWRILVCRRSPWTTTSSIRVASSTRRIVRTPRTSESEIVRLSLLYPR